jgi:hypothetical protein
VLRSKLFPLKIFYRQPAFQDKKGSLNRAPSASPENFFTVSESSRAGRQSGAKRTVLMPQICIKLG